MKEIRSSMSLSENEESESCGVVDDWKTFHTLNLLGGAGTKPSSSIVDSSRDAFHSLYSEGFEASLSDQEISFKHCRLEHKTLGSVEAFREGSK